MKDYIPKIKDFFTVKMILSIISIGGILPLSQALYWTFETSYFGYFGVTPEIFNRPVFSSGFIGVWLFAESIQPVFWAWNLLMGFIFIFLVVINFGKSEPQKSEKSNEGQLEERKDGTYPKSTKSKNKIRLFFCNLVGSISESISLPYTFWGVGLLAFFVALGLFIWASNKGAELAQKQMNSYLQDDFECIDGFNNNNIGCFMIEGIDQNNLLVITNSKTHLIFLSRVSPTKIDENGAAKTPTEIKLHVVEKTANEVFKITREYKRRPGS